MIVLEETAGFVAIAKPAGIAVIPGRGETPADSLRGQAESDRGEKLWVVHRLDRDTSGVVLFARTSAAHRELSMAFEAHQISKTYLAWTLGTPNPAEGLITLPLHTARKGRMRPALPGEEESLASETEYRTIVSRNTTAGAVSKVEVHPRSGRQHQIRVHLRSVGAPLLVDPLYGKLEKIEQGALGDGSPPIERLTLHAASISFTLGGVSFTIHAPLPEDLSALNSWLEARV